MNEKEKSSKGADKQTSRRRRAPVDVEVEVKLPCEDLTVLTSSGLIVEPAEPRHFEDNWVYELPDGKLRKGQYLRIRYVGNGDGAGQRHEGWLTYKGKSRRESAASKTKNKGKKVREEIETPVGLPNKVVKIFKRLGLERSFRYQKYRSVFRITLDDGRSLLAMFDETPIGNFLELEGDSNVIEEVASRLGYSADDFIVESYIELQVGRCKQLGKGLTDMVFSDSAKKSQRQKTRRSPAKPKSTGKKKRGAGS